MAVAVTPIGRYFRLEFSDHPRERQGSRFLTEVTAGFATFFAMAYIISVNASIVSCKLLPISFVVPPLIHCSNRWNLCVCEERELQ
jgi:xanthine/uracil/vitamin C permease (AzgA family)